LKIGLIFPKRLAKLAKTKLEKKKKNPNFFVKEMNFFFVETKNTQPKAHGEISQCIWRALYIALNIALRKEEEKMKRLGVNGFRGR
jgi:hypothetical protein